MTASSAIFELDRIQENSGVDLVHWQPSLPSTNSLAIERTPSWEGHSRVLVLADEQTAGRGRSANHWWSGRGSLTMSLWIRDGWSHWVSSIARASLLIGTAICDTLECFRKDGEQGKIGLKWPNDVWLAERKLGGVLVEKPAPGEAVVLGVGLNLNNSFAAAPEELQAIATSTRDQWQRDISLSDVVIALVRELEVQLSSLSVPSSSTAARWRELSVLDGRTILFRLGDRRLQATCRGIDEDGSLMLQTDAGVERFLAGTIEQVFSTDP